MSDSHRGEHSENPRHVYATVYNDLGGKPVIHSVHQGAKREVLGTMSSGELPDMDAYIAHMASQGYELAKPVNKDDGSFKAQTRSRDGYLLSFRTKREPTFAEQLKAQLAGKAQPEGDSTPAPKPESTPTESDETARRRAAYLSQRRIRGGW